MDAEAIEASDLVPDLRMCQIFYVINAMIA